MNQDMFLGMAIGILITIAFITIFGKVIIGPWECFEFKNQSCINWYKVDEQ